MSDSFTYNAAVAELPSEIREPLAVYAPSQGSDTVAAVRQGMPYALYQRVRRMLGAPDALLARVLAVSERTLQRRQKEGRFNAQESDRLLLLVEVVRLAVQALDGIEPARSWLQQPHSLFSRESPLEHMDTIAGIEEVKDMLYGIEYSMPV